MAARKKIPLTTQLATFSVAIEEYIRTFNELLVYDGSLGGYVTDFNRLTICDILADVPLDVRLTAKYHTTEEDGKYILEFSSNEYSMFRTDSEVKFDLGTRFSTILTEVKKKLLKERIRIETVKICDKVYRDNYAANGKVRTVYTEIHEIKFT